VSPRRLGIAMSTLFAASGTVLPVVTIQSARSGEHSTPLLIFVVTTLWALSWVAVLGWLHDSPLAVILGSWAAAATNLVFWTLGFIPIAVALVNTAIAIKRLWKRSRGAVAA
jgi:hypothetical protein